MNIFTTRFTDSTDDVSNETLAEALQAIATRYGVDAGDLVTRERAGRTIVWLDEESAEGGEEDKEVAEISAAGDKES